MKNLQRGQAMTELVVVIAALIPLFLLIPIVAKFGHAKQVAQQAARNAAFGAAATHDYGLEIQSNLNAQARDRFFAASDAPIRTRPSATSGDFADQMTNTFSNQRLVKRSGLTGHVSEKQAPGWASSLASNVELPIPGNDYPPNKRGYVTSSINVQFENIKLANGAAATFLSPFDSLNLKMNQKQTLLADPWNASGPGSGASKGDRRSVINQVQALVPSEALKDVSPALDLIGSLPIPLLGLDRLDKLDIGTIEPDIVPIDRLDKYPLK